MLKLTKSVKARLSERLQKPIKGFGVMHYSNISAEDVTAVFRSLSSDFRYKYKLEIPRQAVDAVDSGHGMKFNPAGCYWVVERKK